MYEEIPDCRDPDYWKKVNAARYRSNVHLNRTVQRQRKHGVKFGEMDLTSILTTDDLDLRRALALP